MNCLIVPGLCKNFQMNNRLKVFSIVCFKFTHLCWEQLGEGIGKSKSLQSLSIINCNLAYANHLELLIKGLCENDSL